MRLPSFELHQPSGVGEAVELLLALGDDAVPYAGGTELLLAMKLGMAHPRHLVDLKGLAELRELAVDAEAISIGAGVTHRRLERHPDVARAIPALAEMERLLANPRVRNAGTLGGNLCFAEPHSDPATLLIALGAQVELHGPRGPRAMALQDFVVGAFTTAAETAEILTRITVPMPRDGACVGYARIAFKERPDAAVAVVRDGARSTVVLGAIGPRPVVVHEAAAALADDDVAAAKRAVIQHAALEGRGAETAFTAHLVGVLLERACDSSRVGSHSHEHARR